MAAELNIVPGRFDGKVALLSGVASGLGRATSLRLAAEGASVFGLDVNADGIDETAGLVAEAGGTFVGRVTDVSNPADCHQAVADCVAEFGQLDTVGNIAGITGQHHIADVTPEVWNKMYAVNVSGPFFITQAALPHLKETSGSVVNIASNAGLMGQAYTVPYCATKGAVVNMTRALAMEVVKDKVRINAIAPGGISTPMYHEFEMADGVDFELMRNYFGFRRPSEPEEIAALLAFLASSEARNIHGSILSADGGLTAA